MTRTSVAKLTLNVVFETENRTLETREPVTVFQAASIFAASTSMIGMSSWMG